MNKTIAQTQNQRGLFGRQFFSMRTFLVVWSGQVVSILGSGITGFALGVWIYQQTGSATSFALTLLFNMLPKALLAPFAGILADHYDRRWIMILSDLTAGMATIITAYLFMSGNLHLWHIYLLTAINASASALQGPAFSASLTQLVPKDQFGRANGMLQLGEGVGQLLAPVLAGVLIATLGLGGVLLVDMATFLFAVGTLFLVRFPSYQKKTERKSESKDAWLLQLRKALGYLWDRPGLLSLVLVFTLVNFFVGVAEAVLTPMVLNFTTPDRLGLIMTIGGVGMLGGSLLMSIFGGGQRKVYAVFGAYAMLGVGVLIAGLSPSIILVAVAVFIAFFFLPTVMSGSQAIMQAKVSPDIQGRVFGLRIMLNNLSFALAFTLSGYLADTIFEPLLMQEGVLAGNIGRIIGIGPGRGMGLMFVLMGILAIITALSAFGYPRLRRVEIELPDMVDD
jgi:MFS family permease